jgi:diguanylate cyclase (GGDEF)-like protein
MSLPLPELRRTFAQWGAVNASVADIATTFNLERLRMLTPAVAVLNGVHVLVFGYQLLSGEHDAAVHRWLQGLLIVHLLMGLCMAACGWVAHRFRYAGRSLWGRVLPLGIAALALGFSIAVVAIDQWITPNITPFLMTCMIMGLVAYLRPLHALLLYTVACGGFYFALAFTQTNATQLLSNRVNGIAACLMGWSLAVILWRKFTTITMQQSQLEKASAELQTKQRQLERLTRLDGLTGLYNRNTFVDLAQQELNRAQRNQTSTAILIMDLDHFKRVNDTWGHPAGDAVLRNVAAAANATVRSTDLVGRLGGEEFIVLLPGTSGDAARRIAEKLRTALEASPVQWEQTTICATASIGIAGTTALEKRSFDSLYSDADKALYLAKQRGRNRVV